MVAMPCPGRACCFGKGLQSLRNNKGDLNKMRQGLTSKILQGRAVVMTVRVVYGACGCSGQRRCGRVRVSARISGVLATSGHLNRSAHEMTGALQLKKGEGNWAVGKGL